MLLLVVCGAAVPDRPRLPSHIKIGSIDYKVSYYSSKENRGEIDFSTAEISINRGMSYDVEAQVLMHEIKHGELYPAMRALLSSDAPPSEDEFIEGSTFAEIQVLRDNPQLLKYLGLHVQ